MNVMVLTEADLAAVTDQLGRPPRGDCRVAARCPAGHVAVLETRALSGRPPFPTLYWLTCPTLRRAIADLERRGVIADLDARLADDGALRDALAVDHDDYVNRRGSMPDRGIAGMRHLASVKCLHAHYAHHLASRNVIGAILERDYGITRCR